MPAHRLALASSLHWGWVALGCAMCASIARQGAAVATLSVFITPMTGEFGWSRAAISGAVSLGGLLGALSAPLIGRWVDRAGTRAVLAVSAVVVSATTFALAGTQGLVWFYVAFAIGRMAFTGPFDIGISAVVANWFVRRRAVAMSAVVLTGGIGLAIMPFVAQVMIDLAGWRGSWMTVAVIVLVVGALPCGLLLVRRPEDVGLGPDLERRLPRDPGVGNAGGMVRDEPAFTARQALASPAAWLLMGYTALVFPVQAGMSLHQAPYLIERGLAPAVAATVVSTFSLSGALASPVFGWLGGRYPVRIVLAGAALVLVSSTVAMRAVSGPQDAIVAAVLFGIGIAGILTLPPVAYADYFGRRSFGAIRGVVLPVQVLGQAAGPLIAGLMRDHSGSYDGALALFTGFALAAVVLAILARPPRPPRPPGAVH